MKGISETTPVVTFKILCPDGRGTHPALIKTKIYGSAPPLITSVECHGSFGKPVCASCLRCVAEIFANDREPDDLTIPIDPRTSPAWTE